MRISLKKEGNKMCLAFLLRSIAAATSGRSRPLVHVLEHQNGGVLGHCCYGDRNNPMDFV